MFGLYQGYGLKHCLFDVSLIVMAPAVTELLRTRSQTLRSTAASFALVTCSAILTELSGGYIEAHFHFFVMLAVIALYQNWVPFLISILYVLLHHGLGGLLDPGAVYNHPDAVAHPWKWAGIHASFVAAACLAYLVSWRWNELTRAQTEHILKAAGEGIIGLDADGRILFMNPAAERIAGRLEQDLLGKPLEEIIELAGSGEPPEGPQSARELLFATPEHAVLQGQVRNDRRIVPIEFIRTSIRDRQNVTGAVITIRDVTERKAAEDALRESEQRFRSLVQNASDLITVMDADTTVRYQSPSVDRILSYSPGEFEGRRLADLIRPDDAGSIPRLLNRPECQAGPRGFSRGASLAQGGILARPRDRGY